jgi:hypothetical protein
MRFLEFYNSSSLSSQNVLTDVTVHFNSGTTNYADISSTPEIGTNVWAVHTFEGTNNGNVKEALWPPVIWPTAVTRLSASYPEDETTYQYWNNWLSELSAQGFSYNWWADEMVKNGNIQSYARFENSGCINNKDVDWATFHNNAVNGPNGKVSVGTFIYSAVNLGDVDYALFTSNAINNGNVVAAQSFVGTNSSNGNIESIGSFNGTNEGYIGLIESTYGNATIDGTVDYVGCGNYVTINGNVKYALMLGDENTVTINGTVLKTETAQDYYDRIYDISSPTGFTYNQTLTANNYVYAWEKATPVLEAGDVLTITRHISSSEVNSESIQGNAHPFYFLAVNESLTYNGVNYTTNTNGVVSVA